MDMDNGQADGPGNGSMDIEQSLLHQFSCMGTTDKEELVQQLQKFLGTQLNYATAVFFLDMNNWNLQAAICSYFDIESPSKLPSMGLISDPIASECENIEPLTNFTKTWHVMNNGTEPWPTGCYLQCASGDNMGATQVTVSSIKAGDSTFISVQMTSPAQPGIYQCKWRMCTQGGSYFGDPLWVIITVVEEGTMALTQQLSHFSDLGSSPVGVVPPNPFTQHRSEYLQDDLSSDSKNSRKC